jgi:hypothetical protein
MELLEIYFYLVNFTCLKQVLIPYNISEKPITQTQQEILDEITANETYVFKISEQETEWRMGRKLVLENRKLYHTL